MRVVIVGGGADGSYLAERLVAEGEDVAVIEIDPDRAAHLRNRLDALIIVGNGASPTVQTKAGVGAADLLIALSDNDGANVVACQTAAALGVGRTVARVEDGDLRRIIRTPGLEALDGRSFQGATWDVVLSKLIVGLPVGSSFENQPCRSRQENGGYGWRLPRMKGPKTVGGERYIAGIPAGPAPSGP